MNPLENLPLSSLDDDLLRWTLSWDYTGGFIGLYSQKNDCNIYSTGVYLGSQFEQMLDYAHRAHFLIQDNLDKFRVMLRDITLAIEMYKEKMEDFIKIEVLCRNLEEWINEGVKNIPARVHQQ